MPIESVGASVFNEESPTYRCFIKSKCGARTKFEKSNTIQLDTWATAQQEELYATHVATGVSRVMHFAPFNSSVPLSYDNGGSPGFATSFRVGISFPIGTYSEGAFGRLRFKIKRPGILADGRIMIFLSETDDYLLYVDETLSPPPPIVRTWDGHLNTKLFELEAPLTLTEYASLPIRSDVLTSLAGTHISCVILMSADFEQAIPTNPGAANVSHASISDPELEIYELIE